MTGSHFKRIGVSALTVAAMSLTACGSAASSGGTSDGGTPSQTLTIGYDSDPAPQGYDPLLYAAGQRLFYESLYQSLFVQTSSGGVAPGLVASFSYNAKKTQLTLKLKSGITFTDGSKLTAQLVKENLDRRSNAKLQSYGAFAKGGAEQITSVTAPDASTVVLNFAAPQANFQTNLAGEPGMIVGQQGVTDPSSLETAPDGSGPYALSSAVKGSSYTVTRRAGAATGTYPYSTIVYKPFLDKQARANAQISGQTDVSILDASTAATAQSNGVSLAKNGGTVETLLVFDKTGSTAKAFGNKDARLALSYAIDRAAFTAALAKGSHPTANAFPQASPGYDTALDASYAFSVAKAKQLLTQAGYPNGFSFTITSSPTDEAQLEFLQKEFAAIGVTMNITETTSTAQLFAAVNTQPMGFIPLTWASEIGITAGVLVGGFANPHRTSDPVIGAALGAASNASGDGYPAALKKLNDALVDEAWVIPVTEEYSYAGYNAKKVTKPVFPGQDGYPLLTSLRPVG
ncbi:MAG TPA: ABC transporter substrate-binding protein [Trebonia sp.]|nr:ABC transporter substrate-binding protein [Trebonia sp.]